MKKVLVTGGAGFIGFHLAKKLSNEHEVVICDNLWRGKDDDELKQLVEKPNVAFVKCDLTKPEEVANLGENYDEVYHLAAIQGTKNFYDKPHVVSRTNLLSCINILDWFVEKSRKGKMVYSSSSETYAGTVKCFKGKVPTPEEIQLTVEDPYNPRWSYGASKIMGEVLFANYGKAYEINFATVRYHNVYGPRMGFDHVVPEFIERTLKQENPFQIYGGEDTRAFCYIDDAIAGTRLVMESNFNNATIHVGNDKGEIKIVDLAKTLHKLMDYDVAINVNPAPKGSVPRRCPDITKLRLLGFEPKIDLETGLKHCVEWYSNYFKTHKQ